MKASLTLGTQLSMTQRVQQAIALLPMSLTELNSFVQDQLDENPFLMEAGPRDTNYSPNSSIEYISKTMADESSTIDELARQLRIHTRNEADLNVGTWILYNLDERGFFTIPLGEAAHQLNTSPQHVHDVLELIHTFEPIGVGAHSIAHCWRIQLKDKNQLTPELDKFLSHIEKLSTHSLTHVCRVLGYSMTLCQNMLNTLRTLPPYPFSHQTAEDDPQTLVIDVLTFLGADGCWKAELNPEAMPSLLLNNTYIGDIKSQLKKPEEKTFVRERIGHARWLIQALQERAEHLLTVAEHLLEAQHNYWTHGPSGLHPMTLKDMAERTGLHVSTISRLTTSKYIQTPHGAVPLKFFFSRSLTSLVSDSYESEGASSTTIQHRLRQFVQDETPATPYSDEHLVEMFQNQGILVARRTINKYRQILNIPSSNERRRLYTLNPQNRF